MLTRRSLFALAAAVALLAAAGAQAAGEKGTVTLTASAPSVAVGGQVTLNWATTATADGTAASSCTGSWASAALPASGSAQVTVSANTTYTITCTWDDLTTTLSWTPPTMNTDGSAIAGSQLPLSYTVNEGASGAEQAIKTGIAASTYVDVAAADGNRCYTLIAMGADNVSGSDQSVPTNELCVTLAKATAAATAAVTVIKPVPAAPTNFTVQ